MKSREALELREIDSPYTFQIKKGSENGATARGIGTEKKMFQKSISREDDTLRTNGGHRFKVCTRVLKVALAFYFVCACGMKALPINAQYSVYHVLLSEKKRKKKVL